jgi:VCBS repeat protein
MHSIDLYASILCHELRKELPMNFKARPLEVSVLSSALVFGLSLAGFAADCNGNGRNDETDIALDQSKDCNRNGVPDECDVALVTFAALKGPAVERRAPTALADLDGDHDVDVLVPMVYSEVIGVFSNTGDGSLVEAPGVEGGHPFQVAPGDFDGDDDQDLAVIDDWDVTTLVLRSNKGNLAFDAPADLPTAGRPVSLATGDLDADGKLDLVVANDFADISILLNQGAGSFATPANYAIGERVNFAAPVGDLDDDGDVDLVALDLVGGYVLSNEGDGSFMPARKIRGLGGNNYSAASADLDADGDLDLALAVGFSGISVVLNDGSGSFSQPATYSWAGAPDWMVVGDLDADGDVDLSMASDQGTLSVLLNSGEATFPLAVEPGFERLSFLKGGDLDGNGKLDLVALSASEDGSSSVTVLLNVTGSPTSQDSNHNGIPDECEAVRFHRGDPNDDGQVSLTDAIHVLGFLFLGGVPPACMEAANVDDDDKVGITDGIFLLEYLFITGIAPLPPGPVDSPCAMDPAVSPVNLGCESYTHC